MMHVRNTLTRAIAAAIAVMSAATVMRGAANEQSPSRPAATATDRLTLERATPRLPLLPSHPAVFGAAQAGAAAAVPPTLLAEQVFKNVQALKGISASDFMGTMGIMSASLGFDCSNATTRRAPTRSIGPPIPHGKSSPARMVNMVTAINQDNSAADRW